MAAEQTAIPTKPARKNLDAADMMIPFRKNDDRNFSVGRGCGFIKKQAASRHWPLALG
jgi:hypothetical protein